MLYGFPRDPDRHSAGMIDKLRIIGTSPTAAVAEDAFVSSIHFQPKRFSARPETRSAGFRQRGKVSPVFKFSGKRVWIKKRNRESFTQF